jgi:hypothetical protein
VSALVAGVGTCVIAAGLLLFIAGQAVLGGAVILVGAILVLSAHRA